MKHFFEEHTSVIIICIVVSLILCILGCVKGLNEDAGKINGSGLLKIVGDNLTDTIDAYQKQAIPSENLIDYSKITGISYGAAEKPFNTCYCSISNNIIKVTGVDDWAGSFLRLGTFEPGTYINQLQNEKHKSLSNFCFRKNLIIHINIIPTTMNMLIILILQPFMLCLIHLQLMFLSNYVFVFLNMKKIQKK